MTVQPADTDPRAFYQLLTACIAPRPICLASTLNLQGVPNLSPFSFFNLFGSNPPLLVFSPLSRGPDSPQKDTLNNLRELPEVVVNVVSFDLVQQSSLASGDYPPGVNEFPKAGLSFLPATLVRPGRVKESPVNLECRVDRILETGQQAGAGNLILCEILLVHVADRVLDSQGMIDPQKIDLVARMGGNYYCRASGKSVFEAPRPGREPGIGMDGLPVSLLHSPVLTGRDLAQLAHIPRIPEPEPGFQDLSLSRILHYFSAQPEELENELHRYAHKLLEEGRLRDAWQVLLFGPD